MDISKVTFPIYKLRSYLDIDTNPLGVIKVTTIKGVYILDDLGINKSFAERRAALSAYYPKDKIYKLKEKVAYLRQLVKYKSGSVFIDYNGNIIKYKKSSKLFEVKSQKIHSKSHHGNWTILKVNGIEISFLVGHIVSSKVKYASIMYTEWGPFLYDITSKDHEPYKRKI